MKKNKKYVNILFFLITLVPAYIVSNNNPFEKEFIEQQIIALKERIKAEEKAYQKAMQDNISDLQKSILTLEYQQKRRVLFKQIQQQRDILNKSSREQLLWNTAKVVGPIALIGLMIYAFFTGSPVKVEEPLLSQQVPIVEAPVIETTPSLIVPVVHNEPETVLSPSLQSSLTTDYYEQYRKKSNMYGNLTATLSLVAVLSGNVVLLPVIASTYLGSWYYAIQALKNKS